MLVPMVTIVTGGLAGQFVGPGVSSFMTMLGNFINTATVMQPIPMGIIIAIVMGMALTAPISSAAIAISLGLTGLAAGAATVGCCANMIGFAVASYRENKLGGFIAQGLGNEACCRVGNIVRRPQIWLPAILTSAILGPLSTTVFAMTNIPEGAGMGTSGLVGQFGTWASMSSSTLAVLLIIKIVALHFVLPAILALIFSEIMRKKGWIKFGDMKLTLK